MNRPPSTPGVALDVSALQVAGYAGRGVGRYVTGYARALRARSALSAALLAPELPPPASLPGELVVDGLVRWDGAAAVRALAGGPEPVAYHVTAPFLHCSPADPEVLGTTEHWDRSEAPRITLVHDLIPMRAPRHYLPSPVHRQRYRARAAWVAASDLILTNSEHTRGEVVELLGVDPGRVVTIGAGVSPYFCPADGVDAELWAHHLSGLGGRPFVLTVGGSDARKGTERAVAAVAEVGRRGLDLALVVAGHLTDSWKRELATSARAAGIGDRVFMAGAVDDELLRAAYRRAVVTVMPSLAEGAGLPVLESAACGTPALASSTTALAETAAVEEALFDPIDFDSIADVLTAAVTDPSRRRRILVAQQAAAASSTWDAVAGRALDAISAMAVRAGLFAAGPGRAPAGAPPVSVALLGHADPEGGGDALVASLRHLGMNVTVGDGPSPSSERRLSSFDHVVYLTGRDGLDQGLGRVAAAHPGWVWIVDGVDPGWLPSLAHRTRGLLVGSAMTEQRVRLLMPPGRGGPPVRVLPFACPDDPAPGGGVGADGGVGLAGQGDGAGTRPVVAAYGPLSDPAVASAVVDAAAEAGADLRLIGPVGPAAAIAAAERAAARGWTSPVQVVQGRQGAAPSPPALLAVQLHESGGADMPVGVLRALAAGLPVLTDAPAAAELPPGTVLASSGPLAQKGGLGPLVARLLASPRTRARLAASGLDFARAHTVDGLARAFAGLLTGAGGEAGLATGEGGGKETLLR